MIKVPAYQCSYELFKNETARFIGKHEIPIYRAHLAGQRPGLELKVSAPAPDLSPETYWCAFESTTAEFARLIRMYGPGLVGRIYPIIDEMKNVVDAELERLARNGGVNPNAPKAMVASHALSSLIASAMPALPPGAKAAEKAARKQEADNIALQLQSTGISSVPDVAAASLSALCLAKNIDPVFALALNELAKETIESGNEAEEGEARSLDLGALAGRSLEG